MARVREATRKIKERSRQLPLMVYKQDMQAIDLIELAYQASNRSASICDALGDMARIIRRLQETQPTLPCVFIPGPDESWIQVDLRIAVPKKEKA